jgi:DNA-binding MarR family transcriptional regulator
MTDPKPVGSLQQQPWLLLQVVARDVASAIGEIVAPLGLTESRLSALRALAPEGGRQIEIARKTGVTAQTAATMAGALVDDGLLTAPPVKFGNYLLTEKGAGVLAAAEAAVKSAEQGLLQAFGPDGLALLGRMMDAAAEIRDDATWDGERCRNGHPRADKNTTWADGRRRCLACKREAQQRLRQTDRQPEITPDMHGTSTGYRYRCRCPLCQQFHTEESARWRAAKRPATGFSQGVAERILALVTGGATVKNAAKDVGVTWQAVYKRAERDEQFGRRLAQARGEKQKSNVPATTVPFTSTGGRGSGASTVRQ